MGFLKKIMEFFAELFAKKGKITTTMPQTDTKTAPVAPKQPTIRLITLSEYLMDRDTEYKLAPEFKNNALVLLEKVNKLIQKSGIERSVNSGWRPTYYNNLAGGSRKSAHLSCEAIDLKDSDDKMKTWIMENQEVLEEFDLYLEDPRYTDTWVHLQTRAVGSGRRVFIPY